MARSQIRGGWGKRKRLTISPPRVETFRPWVGLGRYAIWTKRRLNGPRHTSELRGGYLRDVGCSPVEVI